MSFSASKPYNDLPLLPPGTDVETKAVLKQCIASRSAQLFNATRLVFAANKDLNLHIFCRDNS